MKSPKKLDRLTVLLADDQEIVLRGLKSFLADFWPDAMVRFAKTVDDLVTEVKKKPTAIITEANLSGANGVKLIKSILRIQPDAKILFFTTLNETIYAIPYLKEGAAGFLSKTAPEGEIIAALTAVLAGTRYSSKEVKEKLKGNATGKLEKTISPKLSARELEVAELLVQGDGVLEISKKLTLQMGTVSTYKVRLFQKLNVKNIIELSEIIALYRF